MDPWIGVTLAIAFSFSFPLQVANAKALNIGLVSSFVVEEGDVIALFTVVEGPALFASIWVTGWNEGRVLQKCCWTWGYLLR